MRRIMQRNRRIGDGYATANSRGIMYQSRMRYLKSRDGTYSGRSSPSSKIKRDDNAQLPFSSMLGAARIPCVADKLIPPTELMTRELSLRRSYWKYHPPSVKVKRMDFLEKKENPVLKRKREAIYARIKAAELASERLKREKESWKKTEKQLAQQILDGSNDDERSAILNKTLSEASSSHEDVSDGSGLEAISQSKASCVCQSSEDAIGDFSDFVLEGCKKDRLPSAAASCIGGDDSNEDNNFGGSFAFLADWNKKTNVKRYKRPKRYVNIQKE